MEEEPPEEAWNEFYDDVSGARLDPGQVKEASELEVAFMHQLNYGIP